MTANVPVRAATASELLKFRTPSIVYTARVNQDSFSYPIDELTYDGGSGTYTDVQVGCLVYVGSSAGAKDKGVARVRKVASSTKIYIESTSGITFADNDYLTIWNFGGMGVKFGLAIHVPTTVYTARVNQAFPGGDILEIIYDGGTGTLADVLPGMTMYIGSAAGLRDRGIVRIRATPSATVFYVGMNSGVVFQDNDYLTIVKDFALWQRELLQDGETVLMDGNIEYGSRDAACVIRAGPVAAVIKIVEGVATFTPPSPALSACYDGATISSYQYSAPGAASTSNMTSGTGTASWTYDTAGQYLWYLTITDSNGKTKTTYRWVFVDNVSPDFVVSSNPRGDDNGWTFGVTMYDSALTTEIVDRAMVVLYADFEYFGGAAAVIGKLEGYENIICIGWIDGETIVRDEQQGTVTFEVNSALQWMDKLKASPIAMEYTAFTATKWTQIRDMTVDKALAHILLWTSTAPAIMDCFFSGDTALLEIITQPSGTLLSQLQNVALNTIFAVPRVNNIGQLYIQIDAQMMNSTAKSALTTVQTITTEDYEGALEIVRMTSGEVSMIELQCNTYDGVKTLPVYGRAPGNVGKNYGRMDAPSNYSAASQAECNRLAGCLLAINNPDYAPLEITLAHQNRLIDIAPAQYCQISIAAGDTLRGVVLTNQKLIPRSVEYVLAGGFYKTKISFELAVTPVDGISYYPPQPVDETVPGYDTGISGFGSFPSPETTFPTFVPGVEVVTEDDCKTDTDAASNNFSLNFDQSTIRADEADTSANAYFPCAIRIGTATHGTQIHVTAYWIGNALDYVHLYGIADGERVIEATMDSHAGDTAYFSFSPLAAVDVDGFELYLEPTSSVVEFSGVYYGDISTIEFSDDMRGALVTYDVLHDPYDKNHTLELTSGAGFTLRLNAVIEYSVIGQYGLRFIDYGDGSTRYSADGIFPTIYAPMDGTYNHQRIWTGHFIVPNQWADKHATYSYRLLDLVERKVIIRSAVLINVCAI